MFTTITNHLQHLHNHHHNHQTILLNSNSTNTSNGQKKRYSCDQCSYSTDRRDLYRRHENIHRDEKPFRCYVCNKMFNRADHVKKHFLRIHKGLEYNVKLIKRINGIDYSSSSVLTSLNGSTNFNGTNLSVLTNTNTSNNQNTNHNTTSISLLNNTINNLNNNLSNNLNNTNNLNINSTNHCTSLSILNNINNINNLNNINQANNANHTSISILNNTNGHLSMVNGFDSLLMRKNRRKQSQPKKAQMPIISSSSSPCSTPNSISQDKMIIDDVNNNQTDLDKCNSDNNNCNTVIPQFFHVYVMLSNLG